MQRRSWRCALLASGCDYSPQHKVPTAQPSEETFRDFGSYEVHYNAVRTDALTPEVARNYGIQRSANRVMLNVTVLHKEAGTARKPVEADVKVDARNLNEQLKDLELRRVSEGEAIYYIGEVSISGTEILVFDITRDARRHASAAVGQVHARVRQHLTRSERESAPRLKKPAKKVGALLNPRRILCYFPARLAGSRDRSSSTDGRRRDSLHTYRRLQMAKKNAAPTKSEILAQISKDTGLAKKQVSDVFESLGGVVKKSLKGSGLFTLPGLLKMKVVKKPATKAREGVNPFTGEKMMFKAKPASKKVRIAALKNLKEMVN